VQPQADGSIIRPFLRAAAEVDLAKARPWSAARRAAVVLVVVLGSWAWLGSAAATSAGIAALFIGVMDRQKSPRLTVRVMGVGTVAMAATHLVADSLAPWPLTVLLILVVIAFAEGASLAMHPDAPQVLHYCGTIAATALVVRPEAGGAALNTVVVLLAGGLQTLATALAWRFIPTVREDEAVAAQVALVADSLAALAATADLRAPDPSARSLAERAARQATAVQRVVARSDLATYRVELLTVVLWATEQARLAGRAASVVGSVAGGRDGGGAGEARRQLSATAATLRLGAGALAARGPARESAVEALLSTTESQWFQAAPLRPALADFQSSVLQLVREDPERVAPARAGAEEWRRRVRVAVTPGSLSFRLGLRIAVAAAAAMAVALGLGLVRASWAGNAALSIFRPDTGGTLPRIVLRAAGASAAAGVVVALALASGPNRGWMLLCMALAVYLAYWLGPTNYGLFGFAMSLSILMVLSAMGADPVVMAIGRCLDTLVGCAVCVAVAFLLPVWRVEQLPATLARSCRSLAGWLEAIAGQLAEPERERRLPPVRRQGELTRDLLSDTAAMLRVARTEPRRSVPVARLSLVFAHLADAAQATVAVENVMRLGSPADRASAAGARAAAGSMRACADAIDSPPGQDRTPPGQDRTPPGQALESADGATPGAAGAAVAAVLEHADEALRVASGASS
jgi:hypothetical protein